MNRHRFAQSRRERAQALAAAIAINAALGAAFITGIAIRAEQRGESVIDMFDVRLPPPPPPPEIEPQPKEEAADKPEGAAGKKAEASPVIALPAPVPRPSPVVAAPVPAQGTAPRSGAALSGTGPGAGGSGTGAGGGGSGGGGIGAEARLLGGNRARMPRGLLRQIPQDGGFAHLLLSVGPAGRVTGCRVLTSSGYDGIDAALCAVMVNRSRWSPARDRQGNPITVQVRYTATWSKD